MKIEEWVTTSLWEDGYFVPEKLGISVELYRSGASFPLVTSLIDGCGVIADWSNEPGLSKTDTFFKRLRGMVRRHGASWFYVTDPDNVMSVFKWEETINPDLFNSWKLQEFETNRAAEGGISRLGIGFHDGRGMIIFELDSTFTITGYGTDEFIDDVNAAIASGSTL